MWHSVTEAVITIMEGVGQIGGGLGQRSRDRLPAWVWVGAVVGVALFAATLAAIWLLYMRAFLNS